MVKKLRILTLSVLIGGVIGYLIAWANMASWFSTRWRLIDPPPSRPTQLLASNGFQLWVRSESGEIYLGDASLSCVSNCWMETGSVPEPIQRDPAVYEYTNTACASLLPLFGAVDRIEECQKTMWMDETYAYALRKNGGILAWTSTIYGEWLIFEFMLSVCGSSLFFFLLTLLGIGIRSAAKSRDLDLQSAG